MGVGSNDLLRAEEYYAEVLARGYRRAHPFKIANYLNSAPVDALGQRFNLMGLRACTNSACSSSTVAIGYGADLIRRGKLEAAVCGAGDGPVPDGAGRLQRAEGGHTEPCQPVRRQQNGMNLGEAGPS
jgi:3-oxoacyl-(acyl-carrier-protein) synthase